MKWVKKEDTWKLPIKSWCETIDESALSQARALAKHPALNKHVALMPDCHGGFGMPIGGVIAAKDALLPCAVGVDIGCGMVAVETNLSSKCFDDIRLRRELLDELKKRIPVGEGCAHKEKQEWDGFERYMQENGTSLWPKEIDYKNLGSLGGGNHFVELQKSDAGKIWLMLHFGSRNLGARIEKHYHAIAKKLNEQYHVDLPSPDLCFLPVDSNEGQAYFRDMNFALDYALENRKRMMDAFKETVLEFIPETGFLQDFNIHHNYAALESHFGENYYIHRKGATSAKEGEIGIIPGSMGTSSYIVRGLGNPESFMSCSHGAGRVMSRTEACKTLSVKDCDRAMDGIAFDRWKQNKRGKGAELDLSEAPQSYKPIDEVIASELDLIEPLVRLHPLAVLKG